MLASSNFELECLNWQPSPAPTQWRFVVSLRRIAVVAIASVVGCACSSSSAHRAASTTSTTGPVRTSGASGYLRRRLASPIRLLTHCHRANRVPSSGPNASAGIDFRPPQTAWRFLYHSRDQDGHDVAVSSVRHCPCRGGVRFRSRGVRMGAWHRRARGPVRTLSRSPRQPSALRRRGRQGERARRCHRLHRTRYSGVHTYLAGAAEGQRCSIRYAPRARCRTPGLSETLC